MIYRFGSFELNEERFELTRASGELVHIPARALELLLLLLQNRDGVVDRETLAREVWGRSYLSRSAIPSQVWKVRRALGDTSRPHRFIQTVPHRGLRFIGTVKIDTPPVATGQIRLDDLPDRDEIVGHSSGLTGQQPSIAVLPFKELNEGDRLSGLATALPSDIILALSRLRLFSVISRSSSFRLSELNKSEPLARADIWSDYLLTGTVFRLGDNYSIFTELSETEKLEVIWAERFDVEPRDIHGARDRIVNSVARQIERGISRQEARRLQLKHPESLTAWQAFHIGSWLVDRRTTQDVAIAQTYLRRAVEIQPTFARAWSALASSYMIDAWATFGADRSHSLKLMLHSAEKAYDADPDDPSANVHLGWAGHAIHSGQSPEAYYQHAIGIAPSYAPAHQRLGSYYAYAGDGAEAEKRLTRALSLNPYGLERYAYFRDLAVAKLLQGEMRQANELGCKAGFAPFDELQTLLVALVSNHLSGQIQEAGALSLRVRHSFPGMTWNKVYGTDMAGEKFGPMIAQILSQYGLSDAP